MKLLLLSNPVHPLSRSWSSIKRSIFLLLAEWLWWHHYGYYQRRPCVCVVLQLSFGETSSLKGLVQDIYSSGSYPSIFLAPVVRKKVWRKQCLWLGFLLVNIGTWIKLQLSTEECLSRADWFSVLDRHQSLSLEMFLLTEMAHPNYKGTLTALAWIHRGLLVCLWSKLQWLDLVSSSNLPPTIGVRDCDYVCSLHSRDSKIPNA